MATSPSIQTCLSLTSSFDCDSRIQINDEVESEIDIKRPNIRLSRGHALLRKQIQRSIVFHPQRTYKRRFTFPGNPEHKVIFKKRRRFTSVALPTKFLLGGNINDPLNLRSLEDEKVNQQLNAFTPASSPMPMSRHRTQVQVLIPPNIYDPLNLNTGEEIEFNLLTSKPRKRRRHRKTRRDDTDNDVSLQLSSKPGSPLSADVSVIGHIDDCSENELKLEITPCTAEEKVQSDKIVSPVVPQGSPVKFKRHHSRNFSKDLDDKPYSKHSHKKQQSQTRLQQKTDYIKFRVNAEKFCYGNHLVRHANLEDDQRLQILNKDLFCDKTVLDIGCNTGELTIYIADHYQPQKIIGVDIDKKLINMAHKKVREFRSKRISDNCAFPKSMASLYGQLTKVGFVDKSIPAIFPNNVSFLEANYVPGCEEYLESQKPEFDVILCLRVTKWIHLNFGDNGLKLAFKRMFAQLRYGGCLILEPQPWFTYAASKRITPSMYNIYNSLQLRPDSFCKFLLSEVGFSSCELIGRIYNCTKVYRQPLYLLTKGFQTSYHQNIQMDVVSQIPFQCDKWRQNSDEQGACGTVSDAEYSSYNKS